MSCNRKLVPSAILQSAIVLAMLRNGEISNFFRLRHEYRIRRLHRWQHFHRLFSKDLPGRLPTELLQYCNLNCLRRYCRRIAFHLKTCKFICLREYCRREHCRRNWFSIVVVFKTVSLLNQFFLRTADTKLCRWYC